jgi:pyruvate formate lyase activating enzyme
MLDPDVPQQELSPDEAVRLARNESSFGIAYTYNEPYVGFEYVLDCAIRAREAGLKNIMVTNGYYMPEPFEELAPLVDAMNIDLKSMRDDFYATYVKGSLEPVQRTIETALEKGIHVELTALLITGLNDSEEDVKELVDYVSGLGLDIPLHISRYHPAYKMHRPPTPADVLRRAYEIASSRLHYVYLGNVVGMEGTDTHCPNCGETLVSRSGFSSRVISLDGKRCSACGYETNFVV